VKQAAIIVLFLGTFGAIYGCGRNSNEWLSPIPSIEVERVPQRPSQPPPGIQTPEILVEDSFSFLQSKDRPVPIDILLSVDNSLTMNRYISYARENIVTFTRALNAQSVDFRLGMVKGTEDRDGKHRYNLAGPYPVIRSSESDVIGRIRANLINLTESFRGSDRRTVQAWLEVAEKQKDPALFHSGHPKVLIALTDSEDRFLKPSNAPEAISRLKRAFGSDKWVAIGIGSPSNAKCTEALSPVTRLLENIVQLNGGMMGRVCESNYSELFRRATETVFALLNEFSVEGDLPNGARPVDSSIRVFVDGVEVENNANRGFIWNPGRRSITFIGSYLPPLGARVEVRLQYWL
jgi:hypothetical protein